MSASRFLGAVVAALLVSGCAYDYAQHTDRVGFSAGNAVKANLEAQTASPSDARRYSTADLGRNGQVQAQPAAPTP